MDNDGIRRGVRISRENGCIAEKLVLERACRGGLHYSETKEHEGKELAGHKLSDAVIERLPTLCALSPGGRISFSEVVAFHNVVRGDDADCSTHELVANLSQKWIWSSG